jgi:hypothetical protein
VRKRAAGLDKYDPYTIITHIIINDVYDMSYDSIRVQGFVNIA